MKNILKNGKGKMNIFLISTLSQVVKCRFLTRSRFFFLASFSSLSFWFKNLILKKVLVRTYFRTTSSGTDLNRAWICLTVVSITWYWALIPFFPWMSLKTSSKCNINNWRLLLLFSRKFVFILTFWKIFTIQQQGMKWSNSLQFSFL